MSDYGDMADRVRNFKDNLKDEHDRATKQSMSDMKNAVRSELISNDSVARSVLIRDIRRSKRELDWAFTAHSVHVPEWAKYLEHGTGQLSDGTAGDDSSYKAPSPVADIDAIETWVVEKNITPRYYSSQSELAGAIAQTIGEIGNFPHPFLRPVWFNNSTGYQTVVDANLDAFSTAWRKS